MPTNQPIQIVETNPIKVTLTEMFHKRNQAYKEGRQMPVEKLQDYMDHYREDMEANNVKGADHWLALFEADLADRKAV